MGAELFHAEGQAYLTNLIVAFRNFANASKTTIWPLNLRSYECVAYRSYAYIQGCRKVLGVRNFKLLPRCRWGLRYSGMLRSVVVSWVPTFREDFNPILWGTHFFNCWTLEMDPMLYRNLGNQLRSYAKTSSHRFSLCMNDVGLKSGLVTS
jgi:hypothetical protein